LRQKAQVAESGQLRRGVGGQALAQADRVTGIVTRDCLGLGAHDWFAREGGGGMRS
jgi:hypothetical protein